MSAHLKIALNKQTGPQKKEALGDVPRFSHALLKVQPLFPHSQPYACGLAQVTAV